MAGVPRSELELYKRAFERHRPAGYPGTPPDGPVLLSYSLTFTDEDVTIRMALSSGQTLDVQLNVLLACYLAVDFIKGGRQAGWMDEDLEPREATDH